HYPGVLIGPPHDALRARYLSILSGDVLMNWGAYWTMPYGDAAGTADGVAGGSLMRDGRFLPFRAAADHRLTSGDIVTRFGPYFPPILRDFGRSKFVPFFRNQTLAVPLDHAEDIKVSVAMKRDAPEALLIVGNLSDRNHEPVTLRLDFDALGAGPAEAVEVYDPIMRRVLPHNASGGIKTWVPKQMIRMLIVRPAYGAST
ncbi:MAG: hypothetical protein AAF800_07675, partial [Planctomycetota bacterium]